MNAKLTDTQTAILKAADRRQDGNTEPLPPNLRGGARAKVIEGLLARDLIAQIHHPDRVEYYLTDAGFVAVGRKRKLPTSVAPDPELEAAVAAELEGRIAQLEARIAAETQAASQAMVAAEGEFVMPEALTKLDVELRKKAEALAGEIGAIPPQIRDARDAYLSHRVAVPRSSFRNNCRPSSKSSPALPWPVT